MRLSSVIAQQHVVLDQQVPGRRVVRHEAITGSLKELFDYVKTEAAPLITQLKEALNAPPPAPETPATAAEGGAEGAAEGGQEDVAGITVVNPPQAEEFSLLLHKVCGAGQLVQDWVHNGRCIHLADLWKCHQCPSCMKVAMVQWAGVAVVVDQTCDAFCHGTVCILVYVCHSTSLPRWLYVSCSTCLSRCVVWPQAFLCTAYNFEQQDMFGELLALAQQRLELKAHGSADESQVEVFSAVVAMLQALSQLEKQPGEQRIPNHVDFGITTHSMYTTRALGHTRC